MSLAIVTPTRGRWQFLAEQARAIAPQLAPDDLWLIGCDGQKAPDETLDALLDAGIPVSQTAWVDFDYPRGDGRGNVDRLANALAAFAPPGHHIVEVDDHDVIAPYALSEISHAFEAGYAYIFGCHGCRVQLDAGGEWTNWPTVERDYTPGAFARREYDAIGLRTIRRSLWNALAGRDAAMYPFGDLDMAQRAEAAGAAICCVQQALCTVTIEPDSISGRLHDFHAADSSPSSGTSGQRSTNRQSRSSVFHR